MKNNNIWIHIIWDLYECNNSKLHNVISKDKLLDFFCDIASKNELNIINKSINIFENNSYSINIMLKESHICIHTRPEINYVSFDVFVCNYFNDNSKNAINFSKEIYNFFETKDLKETIIYR